uniref:Uncharacterized protein n=1 Tax=Chromera velia CCMP2878 TaxID=1169474 RepID=A0A0G4GI16_9ALVE|eukprot:Cvel_21977.t1-p1 / transcript=Cvel_21977.t1 / gene=Cvel_21977 / organism=Chromera_velia_CCMP2878 / gene_product=hypothetical protein / transcript_product=hypothetical protein / location=Cvel_scaffold2115:2807-5507(-) / protein_length=313 / sequence_SO=supercontig / SO=protein_coding / is_pseudo=false
MRDIPYLTALKKENESIHFCLKHQETDHKTRIQLAFTEIREYPKKPCAPVLFSEDTTVDVQNLNQKIHSLEYPLLAGVLRVVFDTLSDRLHETAEGLLEILAEMEEARKFEITTKDQMDEFWKDLEENREEDNAGDESAEAEREDSELLCPFGSGSFKATGWCAAQRQFKDIPKLKEGLKQMSSRTQPKQEEVEANERVKELDTIRLRLQGPEPSDLTESEKEILEAQEGGSQDERAGKTVIERIKLLLEKHVKMIRNIKLGDVSLTSDNAYKLTVARRGVTFRATMPYLEAALEYVHGLDHFIEQVKKDGDE